ncbi:MAG: hypothetical protein P8077_08875 [Gammaproteobacteria bacterium]
MFDVWGLGLKDAFVQEVDPMYLFERLSEQPMEMQTPAYCKALIMAASEFSKRNGLKPNWDDKSKKFIDSIPYRAEDYSFEFSENGEPVYISGPCDHEILPRMFEKA